MGGQWQCCRVVGDAAPTPRRGGALLRPWDFVEATPLKIHPRQGSGMPDPQRIREFLPAGTLRTHTVRPYIFPTS